MSSFLFINQYYWPDEAATSQLLTDLSEDLVMAGHTVTVLCGAARYACHEPVEAGSSIQNGVIIERVPCSELGRTRWHHRVRDILSFMQGARQRLDALPRHDVVVAMTSPPLVGTLGVRFHRAHRVPLVLWVQDIYPEVAERLGAVRNGLLKAWLRLRARQIYDASARIVVPGAEMAKTLAGHKTAAGKVSVIPNWADLDLIRATPVTANAFRVDQKWDRDRVLMYSGNVGEGHDTQTMLALVSLLEAEMPSLRFVLVGDSPRHASLMEEARRMGIARLTRFAFQPRHALGDLLGAADAHLVSQKSEVDGLMVPSKFYGIVAAGRPVIFIGSQGSEIGRHITESRLGTIILPGGASAGKRAAMKVIQMVRDESWVVPYIREWAEKHVSRKDRTREFQAMLMEVAAC